MIVWNGTKMIRVQVHADRQLRYFTLHILRMIGKNAFEAIEFYKTIRYVIKCHFLYSSGDLCGRYIYAACIIIYFQKWPRYFSILLFYSNKKKLKLHIHRYSSLGFFLLSFLPAWKYGINWHLIIHVLIKFKKKMWMHVKKNQAGN